MSWLREQLVDAKTSMTRASHQYFESPYAERIKRLEHELYQVRQTIIHLMPENIRAILWGYRDCTDRAATHRWEDEAADQLIELAHVLTSEEGSYWWERAYCPLCRDGSTSPYQSGFAVPEGLRRHLVGWGNVRQCDVTAAVMALARAYWDDKFGAAERAEETEKQALVANRKKTETLYVIDPTGEPQLIDEGLGFLAFGDTARSESELSWAEQRLSDLGFQTSHEGNVRCYTSERGDFVVYADPRVKGKITFSVFKKPSTGA
jgi:hypothetical protein